MSADGPATPKLLASLAIAFDQRGLDRPQRLYLCGRVAGRDVTSMKQLTVREGMRVHHALAHTDAAGLERALADYVPSTGDPIEDAANAAVARFRARNGVVPSPPSREEIPPRVPVPYEPGGRSCAPKRCYCHECPSWVPLQPINYGRILADLRDAERRRA